MTLSAYDNLLLEMRPRPIRSEVAYHRALHRIEAFMNKPCLGRAESEMVEVLSLLIEQYEAVTHPTPTCSPVQMLEHLLEVRGITKAQLAKETGIVRSVLTNVVAGRRTLSKGNAARLSRYFRVPLELLIQGE